jgi:serine/threonine protein kinase
LYRISIDICSALLYLHNNGFTHRDLKASNVLLSSLDPYSVAPVAKLCDFGDTRKMARAMTPKVGTVPYMVGLIDYK